MQLNLRPWKYAPWAGYVALEGMAAIKCNAKGLQGLLQQVFRPLWTPPSHPAAAAVKLLAAAGADQS